MGAVGDEDALVGAEVAGRLDPGRLLVDGRLDDSRDPVPRDRAPPFFHQWPVLRSIPSRRHASDTETPWRRSRRTRRASPSSVDAPDDRWNQVSWPPA